jgi:hypothetical protein
VRSAEGIGNGILTSMLFKLVVGKENVANVRKRTDILEFRRSLILNKLNN